MSEMSISEALRLADANASKYGDVPSVSRTLAAEVRRLQHIIDSRPAINAGLPGTYIEWSQSIYLMDVSHALETAQ